MTVKELIKNLQNVSDPNSRVFITYKAERGCDTCGYGSEVEAEICYVDDLGGKVWLDKEEV